MSRTARLASKMRALERAEILSYSSPFPPGLADFLVARFVVLFGRFVGMVKNFTRGLGVPRSIADEKILRKDP
jgi:hypothetical protein